jgi:hypothetical protein
MKTTPRNLGVALTGDAYSRFTQLTGKHRQELATLFYWRPSRGNSRYSAIIDPDIPWPKSGDIVETGSVSITADYMMRVLASAPEATGIGVIHSHFGDGWQDLSTIDVQTEARELAAVAYAARSLPLVGMTIALDGSLSARFWLKKTNGYHRADVPAVRVVGDRFRIHYHPGAVPRPPKNTRNRIATLTVWGEKKQSKLESLRVGIVGLGSVGSMVAECLARMGVRDFVLVDHDTMKKHNLDRTAGASRVDVLLHRHKTKTAARNIRRCATGEHVQIAVISKEAQDPMALNQLLDCDAVFSCADRHLPRYVLNFLALSHLIPVIDGGIAVDTPTHAKPSLDISWRIQLVRPGATCLGCLEAYEYGKVGLERAGVVDNRSYLENAPELKRDYLARQNVFCFGMSCAAHEVLQFLGYVLDAPGVSPATPQMYQAGAGIMFRAPFGQSGKCNTDCQVAPFTAKAHDLNRVLA